MLRSDSKRKHKVQRCATWSIIAAAQSILGEFTVSRSDLCKHTVAWPLIRYSRCFKNIVSNGKRLSAGHTYLEEDVLRQPQMLLVLRGKMRQPKLQQLAKD
eukprot:307353-Amphidinium_carterae.1